MSAHTDSVPLPLGTPSGDSDSARRALPARARIEHDLELVGRVARGDADAVEQLASRMAPRALRVARALMVGSEDATDAALHALLELLRSHARYRGQLRLERWGDRVTALAVVRFARAVRRRSEPAGALPSATAATPRDERGARTFEQYLNRLSARSRQTLLLRHALGFALGELSEALQSSMPVAKQQLLDARRELRTLVRRNSQGEAAVQGAGAQRWCLLRDREALGEGLSADELAEVAVLEARDAEVWAFVAQVRALELYFEAARDDRDSAAEQELAARAVDALQVTTPTLRTRAVTATSEEDGDRRDFDGNRWVRGVAIGSSVALAAASALALWFYAPPPAPAVPAPTHQPPAPAPAPDESSVAALMPTVEAMPSARTASRGARLRSAGRALPEATLLSQGDTVETTERAGCLLVDPDTELCLAPMSKLKISTLLANARRLELLTGRVVVRIGPRSASAQWVVQAGGFQLHTRRAVFALERGAEAPQLRVRTLRGSLDTRSGSLDQRIEEARSALLRADRAAEVTVLTALAAQRDWDLLATGLRPAASQAASAKPAAAPAPPLEPPAGGSTSENAPSVRTPADDVPRQAAGGPAASASGAAPTPTDAPGAAEPAGAEPARAEPARAQPAGAETAADLPAADLPAGELPAGELPAGELPAGQVPPRDSPAGAAPGGPSREAP